jgi:hypothetical protein
MIGLPQFDGHGFGDQTKEPDENAGQRVRNRGSETGSCLEGLLPKGDF